MSFMDTGDVPSSSYAYRGGRNSRGGRNNYRGGRNSFNGYDDYDPSYQQYQGGRGGRNYNRDNANGNTWGQNSNRGGSYRGRSPNYWGGSTRGASSGRRGGRFSSIGFDDPKDVKFIKPLKGHSDGITAMVIDPSSGQLFTGSKDMTVKMWDLQKLECKKTVEVGGEVDSMLLESGMLFVGMHQPGDLKKHQCLPGAVQVYNLPAGSEHTLQGHVGPVYCLAAANNMLFSGGHDHSIKVWQFNQATGIFEAAVELTAAQGGHSAGVKALQVINTFLFSADFGGNIKVWELSSGQCVQDLPNAHSSVIMSLLAYEGYLLSGSVDGTVKVWQAVDSPGPGAVVIPQPAYCHPPDPSAESNGMYGKVLAMCGTTDAEGRSVLLSSYGKDNKIYLWELPDFSERGHLNAIRNSVAIACFQSFLVAGDYVSGAIKVWKWRPLEQWAPGH